MQIEVHFFQGAIANWLDHCIRTPLAMVESGTRQKLHETIFESKTIYKDYIYIYIYAGLFHAAKFFPDFPRFCKDLPR